MGGSSSKNKSSNDASNQFSEDVWGPQGEALQGLYDQASELYGGGGGFQEQIDKAAGGASDFMGNLQGNMKGGMDDMMGGGSFGDTADIRQKLLESMNGNSQMGNMYNSIVGGEGNTYMDPMVDAMKQGAMENNQMMQSGNAQDAASMGQGGGSRHAMQNAMTNRSTNQDMMNQETMMRGGGYDKDLAMKMGIAQQADQGNQMNSDRLMQMLSGSDANKQFGMGQSGNMQNTGMAGMAPWMQAQQSQWNPMQNWASIIGGPQVLGSGSGSSGGSSKGSAAGGGMFG
jgi:hypothetical protein